MICICWDESHKEPHRKRERLFLWEKFGEILMNQAVIMGMLRHALTIAAGGLVTAGYVDGDTANQIAGGMVGVIGVAWSLWDKRVRG